LRRSGFWTNRRYCQPIIFARSARRSLVNSDSNHYKFGGHERDGETGLDYFGARYYGNWAGRFLTPDWDAKPITVPYANFGNPQSLNLYSYTKNNPTTFGDPDGHAIIDPRVIQDAVSKLTSVGSDLIVGGVKGAANFLIQVDNGVRDALNKVGGNYQHFDELKPSNDVQAKAAKVGEVAAAVVISRGKTEVEPLPDDALVVRGGQNQPQNFTNGTGVTLDTNGNLQGVSVNSAPGATVEQPSQGIPNGQVGVSTVGAVRDAGGDVTPSPTAGNPNHCTLCGITPQKANELFTPTIPNPSK
jgi:RHS repeat-associated protein